MTLWRFLNAREGILEESVEMYRETQDWRATYTIKEVMGLHGSGEAYFEDGSRDSQDPTMWRWQRDAHSPEAKLMHSIGFWGRLSKRADDGAPVAVWRPGALDIAGVVREDIAGVMKR